MTEQPNWDRLIDAVHAKYRPIFEGRSREDRLALAQYYLRPRSKRETQMLDRPRAAKLYCPFACQRHFPSGHRLCINTFTGCAHKCIYCYAAGYSPCDAKAKPGFERGLRKDMEDLERFEVPSAPVHLSNSTDPFQPLERSTGATRFALQQILAHRRRFDMVTILTKNPLLAAEPDYIDLLRELRQLPADHSKKSVFGDGPALRVQVSLAFWRQEACAFYDPGAPGVAARMEGIRALREAQIPVVLRLDPLFPRDPLPVAPERLADHGLVDGQTLEDLDKLLRFAVQSGVSHVVYSVAKLTRPRGRGLSEKMRRWRDVYAALACPATLDWQGGSWRLPRQLADEYVTAPLLQLCRKHGVEAQFCMQDLLHSNQLPAAGRVNFSSAH